jgi:hypothetical protein
MDRRLGDRGLTVYLTWKLDELPSYGDDVVAVVLGDEWCRVPSYAQDVLATFKCYGTSLPLGLKGFTLPHDLLELGKYLRTQIHRLPGLLRRFARRARNERKEHSHASPIFDIPLGYGNQEERPVTPIEERPTDLFFSGSVQHAPKPSWSLRHWIQNPKTISRTAMLKHLRKLQSRRPDLNVDVATTSEFAWNAIHYDKEEAGDMMDAETYSRHMMNTKICVVPRGTSLESYRFFEALRYGCVILSDPLPTRWFYDGSPAITLKNWRQLPEVANRILNNPAFLHEKHRAALSWWEEVCSEDAVGMFMASKVRSALEKKRRAVKQ